MPEPCVAAARRLAGAVAASAEANACQRRLADDLAGQLKAAGLLRALIPGAFGGPGWSLPDFLEALEILAAADASTAWCVAQGAVIGTTTLWLPEQTIRTIWSDPDAAVANGPPGECVIAPEGDGYRVSGRWGFSSGCQHATIMTGACRRADARGWLMPFFPRAQAEFHDTWRVSGLSGTGSFEFSVRDLRVPAAFVADLSGLPAAEDVLFRIPTGLLFAVSFAAVALGVSRSGLDAAYALARDKVPRYSAGALQHDRDAQRLLGEAEARWRAARSYLHTAVGEVLARAGDGAGMRIAEADRIALRLAGTHGIREAVAVFDAVWSVAGSSGIYLDHPLQRPFQDIHVIAQHAQGRVGHYGYAARFLLGQPFEPGPLN